MLALYEMTVGSFAPFSYAVLFSKDLWIPKAKAEEATQGPEAAGVDEPAPTEAAAPEPQPEPTPEQAPASEAREPEVHPSVTVQIAGDASAKAAMPRVETPPPVQASRPERPAPAPAPAASAPLTEHDMTGLLGARVEAVMSPNPVWVSPEDSVLDVLRAMQQRDVGYVLVGRNGAVEGIASRSSVLGAISPYLRPMFTQWRRPEDDATLNIKIKWAMSRPVQTVAAQAALGQAIERMQQFGGRCLPVTGQDGKVVGMLTVFDIFAAMDPHKPAGRPPQAPCLMA